MSLSFVKSAVLSSTDGVSHNEETTIDTKETQSLRAAGGGSQKPLFEQLRANKDAEEEKNAEFQRSLRGTATLDDEDCAHLNSVEQLRNEKAHAVKSGIEREVALFRAAREDRALTQTVMDGDDDDIKDAAIKSKADPTAGEIPKKEAAKKIVPKFTIKKKRKRDPTRSKDDNVDTTKKAASSQGKKTNNAATGQEKQIDNTKNDEGKKELSSTKNADDSDSDNGGGGLLGLGCYDSDSE